MEVEPSNTAAADVVLLETHVQYSVGSPLYTEAQLAFCRLVPKIELHAHLNGSVRLSTLRELAAMHNIDPSSAMFLNHMDDRTLTECFGVFEVVHKITTSHQVLRRITREMCEDAEEDGVVYMEIRTTPKDRPEVNMTKRSYVEAVLEGIDEYRTAGGAHSCITKLLLSIDRRENGTSAMETVHLAASFSGNCIIGIDLSGNPSLGNFSIWLSALRLAGDCGLKVTLHAAEVPNAEEMHAMLNFAPDRFGHVCFLDDACASRLVESRIPLELCLTSNLITKLVASYAQHHFIDHYRAGRNPIVLCTDDSGVFGTCLSREYAIAMGTFGLSECDVLEMAKGSLEAAFLSEQEKEALKTRVNDATVALQRRCKSGSLP
ncbi:Metallo-dependent hydrolase [Saitoella complicata NRRL Y-17804]|uniref:Adenosine deaminase domain-containing protein n=1 Tax=Saitoella complicata (strain BCRC 22490 / CBS 7301 / JCM 7358 / NBRC 10748 / NRRL Y-17804) TaxID=698492 RepID=A0A0E9NR52_SAICN|nr:Metallo-dependent hydrolase [Saitoella complicata NRRL Y-17804]ODQ51659.1 Metallo-dependent hydrolase [Saitoella complicata NRRL Y-17804]GAO52288.1 hypothetical protein G7K_6368-t1 [Saitoella complicata NRRL Y-17804]